MATRAQDAQLEIGIPSTTIHQWQWEQSIDELRRGVDESVLRRHWKTTGDGAVDSRARAHISEWQAVDIDGVEHVDSSSVIDSMVGRALHDSAWELYVVEGKNGPLTSVRRLRDQQGLSIRWLEGRRCPPTGAVIALRAAHLNPPGLTVATLPVVFGDRADSSAVVEALIRAFGDASVDHWQAFMKSTGARIIIEYGLAHLERCAAGGEAVDDQADRQLLALQDVFATLEARTAGPSLGEAVELGSGKVATVADVAAGPHLLVFDSVQDFRLHRQAVISGPTPIGADEVARCVIRRLYPEELSWAEKDRARTIGLNPEQDGLVWLKRRDGCGRFVDPDQFDRRAAIEACRRLAMTDRKRVA